MGRLNDFKALKKMADQGSLKIYRGIPEDKENFAPKEGMMTCRQHIKHISLVELQILRKIVNALNLNMKIPKTPETDSIAVDIDTLEQTWELTNRLLEKMTDNDLDKPVKLEDENIEIEIRRLMHVMVEHQVHHRGELVVYFREMGKEPPKRWDD